MSPESNTPASERVDRVRSVLLERARALARPPAPPPAADALEVLAFVVGREVCALETRFVYAVFRVGELTPLPGHRSPVAGVTGWRGDILALLDLRRPLGLQDGGAARHVIVLGRERPVFGVLADELRDVRLLEPSQLFPAGETREPPSELVRAVVADGLVLLDGERLLALLAESKPT